MEEVTPVETAEIKHLDLIGELSGILAPHWEAIDAQARREGPVCANGFYQRGMMHWAQGDIIWKAAGGSNIKVALIDSAEYIVDLTNHEFLNPAVGNPPSASTGYEEVSGNLTLIDAATDGVCDANDITFIATAGDQCEGVLVFKDTGAPTTSPLLLWWDTASGLPVTLGGDVTVSWDNGANKICRI